jgi:ketosteroid isomerase-like protein
MNSNKTLRSIITALLLVITGMLIYGISQHKNVKTIRQSELEKEQLLNSMQMNLKTGSNSEKDKEILIAMVKEMTTSMTGKQSTKNWAENALWFDIVPFASKGIKPAVKMFDDAFGTLKSCDIEILSYDVFINGNMAVICTVQKMKIVRKDGTVNKPRIIRQTDCFEKQDGVWKIIHEHSSAPLSGDWDGIFVTE